MVGAEAAAEPSTPARAADATAPDRLQPLQEEQEERPFGEGLTEDALRRHTEPLVEQEAGKPASELSVGKASNSSRLSSRARAFKLQAAIAQREADAMKYELEARAVGDGFCGVC